MTTQKTPPRDDVCRSVPFTLTRDGEADGDGLSFEDTVRCSTRQPGSTPGRAFSTSRSRPERSASRCAERAKFQFDHGHHPLIGSVPIGTITDIHEDDRGLYVAARLGQHIVIDLIREAIASGAIDGMSFRFSVVRDDWQDNVSKVIKDERTEPAALRRRA